MHHRKTTARSFEQKDAKEDNNGKTFEQEVTEVTARAQGTA